MLLKDITSNLGMNAVRTAANPYVGTDVADWWKPQVTANHLPTWQDAFNQWNQNELNRLHSFGWGKKAPIGIDRAWGTDYGSAQAKNQIDAAYLKSIDEYNKLTDGNAVADKSVLGVNAQPNKFMPSGSLDYHPQTGSFFDQALPALAGLAVTAMTGGAMAPWMAGALGGGFAGLAATDSLQGALKGGVMGGIGGGLYQGLDSAVGYNPGIADMVWSEAANPFTQAAVNMGTNAATGALKGGISSAISGGDILTGMTKGGLSSGIQSGINAAGGTESGGTWWDKLLNSASGNLANFATNNIMGTGSSGGGNMSTVTDWAGALAPFLTAYQTSQNKSGTSDAYNRAINLVTTPSPDQAKYRAQLSNLMANPGSIGSSPVYKAMLDQGMSAVNRTAAAKGMLGSGNRLADLMKMGQQTASQFYFPQQQALAQLSGVGGDAAGRALAAQAVLGGNTAQNEMSNSILKDILAGTGVKSPQQQMIDALIGGGTSTKTIFDILKGFGGGSSDYTGGQDFNDWFSSSQSIPEQNFWQASGSSPTALDDYTSQLFTPYDLTWNP